MAKTITPDEVKQINDLYYEHGTYAAVARLTGRAASTVKKYVIPNYIPEGELQTSPFDESLIIEDPDLSHYKGRIGDMCIVSEEEWAEIEELRKEVSM